MPKHTKRTATRNKKDFTQTELHRHTKRTAARRKEGSTQTERRKPSRRELAWRKEKNYLLTVKAVSLILLVISLFLVIDTLRFLGRATPTTGTVVWCSIVKNRCTPTVSFKTARGETVSVTMSSFFLGYFTVGEQVPLAYDPDNPQDARMTDVLSLWPWPVSLFVLGSLFFLVKGIESITTFFSRHSISKGS